MPEKINTPEKTNAPKETGTPKEINISKYIDMSTVKNYAVLIDSENISYKYAKSIFDIISSEYGYAPIKRCYGDFSKVPNQWKEKCKEYAIKSIHHYKNTGLKNSSDLSLVIDAMDILYTSPDIQGFVIVSSDSDFTELIQRLKEGHKKVKRVIGMGEAKTPKSIINACDEFKYLENYYGENNVSVEAIKDTAEAEEIFPKIKEIIISHNGNMPISTLKSKLIIAHPDFDEKNYGYNQMDKFLEKFKDLGIEIEGYNVKYGVYDNKNNSDKKTSEQSCIDQTIEIVKSHQKNGGIDFAKLGQKLKNDGYDYTELGYSKLKPYIKSIPDLIIEDEYVKLKNNKNKPK